MSRRILFKAIALETGEWVQGDYIRQNHGDFETHEIWDKDLQDGEVVDPKTLCQLVIPADGDRPALWEGDVVKDKREDEYVIKWDSSTCAFYVEDVCIWFRIDRQLYEDFTHTGRNVHDKEQ